MRSWMLKFFSTMLLLALTAPMAYTQTINIGVLSYRPIDENQKIWVPLEQKLHDAAPQYEFNVTSHTQSDLDKLVSLGRMNFIIVHPQAFVEMETTYGITNIASLVRQVGASGKHLAVYGGAIVSLAKSGIKTLGDIKGKNIAVTHNDAFGAMLIQRDVLANAGIDIQSDCKIAFVGQPMDNVLEALIKGSADVGFFRAGYIEEMIAKGKIKQDELFVINSIYDKGYPYLHSTPLYPEWAVAATPASSETIIKEVTTAFYRISSDEFDDYHEFSIPLSYKSTRDLMQKYHAYPFEQTKMNLMEMARHYVVFIVLFFIVLFAAITAIAMLYKRQAVESKKQKAQIEFLLANSSDGIHVHDTDGNLLYFSDSFAKMLGYTRDEVSKLRVYDWDKHFDADKIKQMMKELLGKELMFETKHRRKDGSEVDVEIFARGVDLDGKAFIYSSSRDITKLKKAQEELVKDHAIFESIAEGVYAVDTECRCTYINSTALNILGLRGDDVMGKNPHYVFHHLGADGLSYQAEECSILLAILAGEAAKLEDVFIRSDSSSFPVSIVVSPIVNNGATVGSVIVFADITRQKEIEQNLQTLIASETEKRLEGEKLLLQQSKMAMMGELMGAIAHNWRQPLNALAISVQDTKLAFELNEVNSEYISRFVEDSMHSINTMSSTINSFRDFYRPSTQMSEFSISSLIRDSVTILSAQFAELNINTKFETDSSCNGHSARGYGYPSELKQVILNILSNARDAIVAKRAEVGDDFTGTISISLACRVDSNEKRIIVLSIADNGGGVREDVLDRVFEPYFTTKEQGKGVGIGLYIAKNIIERHMKGTLEANNQDDGAVFRLSFDPEVWKNSQPL